MNQTVPLWASHLPPATEAFRSGYHDKPRTDILPLIDWQPRRVLDIGCGGGATGQLLASRFAGCVLHGVERDVQAASRAARHYHQVVQADLDQQALVSLGLPLGSFDTVLLLDVLEHLVNPWRLLASLAQALPPGARVLASLPNIANIEALHALAAGQWPYAEDGLFDITHLRFFTPQGMQALFEQTGFMLRRQASVAHPASRLPARMAVGSDHVETDRLVLKGLTAAQAAELFTIQRLLVAEVATGAALAPPPAAEPLPLPALACRPSATQRLRDRYLEMVRRSVLGLIHEDPALAPQGRQRPFDALAREQGLDWPATAESMIGHQRMSNLQSLAEQVLIDCIPGDLIETGVWRGGACIMMRAVLEAYGERERRVWVADSFAGLPPPSPAQFPLDAGDSHHTQPELAVSLAEVQANFARYGLLDDQVCFLPGWFKDTLQGAATGPLALLRLDGDMYESTLQALEALFPRLSPGGYVIVDDYGYLPSCQAAVDAFRSEHGIEDALVRIDQFGVYWRNQKPNRLRPVPWAPAMVTARVDADLPLSASGGSVLRHSPPPLQVVGIDKPPRSALADAVRAWNLETPQAGAQVAAPAMKLAGWIVGQAQAVHVVLALDGGKQLGRAEVVLPRPDVQRRLGLGADAGFDLNLRWSSLRPGQHIELVAGLADGSRCSLATLRLAATEAAQTGLS